MDRPGPMPEYDAPPVTEVALSVEFAPLVDWRPPHAGRYWTVISDEYPKTDELPALPSAIEKFGEELRQAQLSPPRIQFLDQPPTRSWFISESGTWLIQIQRDRFITNWRKANDTEAYPGYVSALRPRFEREWKAFCKFVQDSKLGPLDVQQCEVTYVNTILKGEGWEAFPEALNLFSFWSGLEHDAFLPAPESLNVSGTFLIPNEAGRLHFSANRVLRQPDLHDAFQLQITARGRPSSTADSDVLLWLDMGREWIVRGFTDLTSPKGHSIWKRRR